MKRAVVLVLVIVLVCAYAMPAVAQEKAKDPVEYSGNVVTGTVNTVGKATGKGKPENVVTDPVNEGGKTVYNASVNTGKTVTGQKQ